MYDCQHANQLSDGYIIFSVLGSSPDNLLLIRQSRAGLSWSLSPASSRAANLSLSYGSPKQSSPFSNSPTVSAQSQTRISYQCPLPQKPLSHPPFLLPLPSPKPLLSFLVPSKFPLLSLFLLFWTSSCPQLMLVIIFPRPFFMLTLLTLLCQSYSVLSSFLSWLSDSPF